MKIHFLITCLIACSVHADLNHDLLEKYCVDCHGDISQKAQFRIDTLIEDGITFDNYFAWQKMHFKLSDDSMPPKKKHHLPAEHRKELMAFIKGSVIKKLSQQPSRAGMRRMNKTELAYTLQDLTGLKNREYQISGQLPDENRKFGFNEGDSLKISPEYLGMAYELIDNVFESALRLPEANVTPKTETIPFKNSNIPSPHTVFAVVNREIDPTFFPHGKHKSDDPPYATGIAITKRIHTLRTTTRRFKWQAPYDGYYRFSAGLWAFQNQVGNSTLEALPTPVAVELRIGTQFKQLIEVDFKRKQYDFKFWLNRGETIGFNPIFIEKYRHLNIGLSKTDAKKIKAAAKWKEMMIEWSGKGLVLESLKVKGPYYEQRKFAHLRKLFGTLTVKSKQGQLYAESKKPHEDAAQLILSFSNAAYRGVLWKEEYLKQVEFFKKDFQQTRDFTQSLIKTYKIILYSPRFFLLDSTANANGYLADLTLSLRLSYFLWDSTPDATLRSLAKKRLLSSEKELNNEIVRMMQNPKFARFKKNFLSNWLDLHKLHEFTPDQELFSRYNTTLYHSFLMETEAYFDHLIEQDRPIQDIAKSDYTFVNRSLAEIYKIPGEFSYHKLSKVQNIHNRGGFLTQAAVLKTTANGVDTSPVVRGSYVMRKFLGMEPLSPPAVAALDETTISETISIRDRFEQHKQQSTTCYNCHKHIDPGGFALENFDAIGQWRDNYILHKEIKEGKHTKIIPVLGKKIDPRSEIFRGPKIANLDQYLSYLASKPKVLARAFLRHISLSATGKDLSFADEKEIEKIIANSQPKLGVRTLIINFIKSPLFLKP